MQSEIAEITSDKRRRKDLGGIDAPARTIGEISLQVCAECKAVLHCGQGGVHLLCPNGHGKLRQQPDLAPFHPHGSRHREWMRSQEYWGPRVPRAVRSDRRHGRFHVWLSNGQSYRRARKNELRDAVWMVDENQRKRGRFVPLGDVHSA